MYSLSVVIPLYNEKKRIGHCLNILEKFLKNKNKKYTEIIFVSDGSTDGTNNIIYKFILKNIKKYNIKLIHYKKNVGKGFAVKKGILKSSKEWKLICDADMSVEPSQFDLWYNKKIITNKHCAYFGSRSHKNSKIETSIIRKLLGAIFKILLKILFNIKINDTQCGFKVFHKSYSKKQFKKITSYGFVFDVELTLILKNENIIIKELPITWRHKKDSKLKLHRDIPMMILGLIKIKFKNLIGKY